MPASAPASVVASQPLPAAAGIGLRAQHHEAVAADLPAVGWFEAHSENYFAQGGSQPHFLGRVREHYPLSLHGVGLSLGSADPLDRDHLRAVRRLIRDFEPAVISEHASWSHAGGVHFNDLLPMPLTEEALRLLTRRVGEVQDFLGRQILLENVSSYLEYGDSTLREWEFMTALALDSGCGLLLDINNVYVSAMNHGFCPLAYLQAIPRATVGEFHLAGHTRVVRAGQELLIDTHDGPVCDAVWDLYAAAIRRFGAVPTLIEWDANLPPLERLVAEARLADRIRSRAHAVAA